MLTPPRCHPQMVWSVDGREFARQRSGGGRSTTGGWWSAGADGKPVAGDAPFGDGTRFHLLLNVAIGSEGTAFTAKMNGGKGVSEAETVAAFTAAGDAGLRMEVDWVRVSGAPAQAPAR